jgi:hypothetical protein
MKLAPNNVKSIYKTHIENMYSANEELEQDVYLIFWMMRKFKLTIKSLICVMFEIKSTKLLKEVMKITSPVW